MENSPLTEPPTTSLDPEANLRADFSTRKEKSVLDMIQQAHEYADKAKDRLIATGINYVATAIGGFGLSYAVLHEQPYAAIAQAALLAINFRMLTHNAGERGKLQEKYEKIREKIRKRTEV